MHNLALIPICIGAISGTVTGLLPGLHVNTLAIILLSLLPILNINKYSAVAFVISMSVTHSFVDYIPSILLGAPEEDSVLSVLPGHRLLLKGKGYEAIKLTVVGGVCSLILCTGILPAGVIMFPKLYTLSRKILPYVLITILLYMIFTEPPERRIHAIIVMIYCGIFGLIVLNDKKALFPALTGLFGISTLVISMKKKADIPEQIIDREIEFFPRGIILGTLAGIFSGLFPSVGSSQSAMVMQNFIRKREKSGELETKEFLVALGGVNTVDAIYAFLALYLIEKPRSGASIVVEKILQHVSYYDFLYIVGVILSSAFLAVLLTLKLAKFFVSRLRLFEYEKTSTIVLCFLFAMILFFSGWRGLLIAAVATSIGMFAQLGGVKKSNCMAVLIIPTILYFL